MSPDEMYVTVIKGAVLGLAVAIVSSLKAWRNRTRARRNGDAALAGESGEHVAGLREAGRRKVPKHVNPWR